MNCSSFSSVKRVNHIYHVFCVKADSYENARYTLEERLLIVKTKQVEGSLGPDRLAKNVVAVRARHNTSKNSSLTLRLEITYFFTFQEILAKDLHFRSYSWYRGWNQSIMNSAEMVANLISALHEVDNAFHKKIMFSEETHFRVNGGQLDRIMQAFFWKWRWWRRYCWWWSLSWFVAWLFLTRLDKMDLNNKWFQQNGATVPYAKQ